jgi:hypothetical protein
MSLPIHYARFSLWPSQRQCLLIGFVQTLSRRLATAPPGCYFIERSTRRWTLRMMRNVLCGHIYRIQVHVIASAAALFLNASGVCLVADEIYRKR